MSKPRSTNRLDRSRGWSKRWPPSASRHNPLNTPHTPRARLDLSVELARARLISRLSPLPAIEQPLQAAFGRVLATEVIAPIDLPNYTNSAMDGFALRSATIANASPDQPVHLSIAGVIEAGSAWTGPLDQYETIRIGTGAAIPAGCDIVIPAEDIEERAGFIEIRAPVPPGRHVRLRGEDLRQGKIAIGRGTILRSQEIGLLAALGIVSVAVIPSPKISIISTGPELLPAAMPSTVNDANGPMLAALAQAAGAEIVSAQQSDGAIEHLRALIVERSRSSDLIITTGGISNSPADSIAALLASDPRGELWDVRLRPGKHFGIARFGKSTLIALPGNPVAAFVGFELLARAAIDQLSGKDPNRHASVAKLAQPIAGTIGRTEAVRGRAWIDETGQLTVEPVGNRGSGVISSLLEANCLIVVPETIGALEPGNSVQIRWIADR